MTEKPPEPQGNKVQICVKYVGDQQEEAFNPKQKIEHVWDWAAKAFGLDKKASGSYNIVLERPGGDIALRLNQTIESYAIKDHECIKIQQPDQIFG